MSHLSHLTTPEAESKTALLKRFFKISKKPLMFEPILKKSGESSSDEDSKKLRKIKTFSSFFSRKKTSSNDHLGQSTSLENPNSQDEPLANPKPAIKGPMSVYWKRLVLRLKNQRKDAELPVQETSTDNDPEEIQKDPETQMQSTNDLNKPQNMDTNQEPELNIITGPERIKPKTPKKKIARNVPGEQILGTLESSQSPVAAEPKDADINQPTPNEII